MKKQNIKIISILTLLTLTIMLSVIVYSPSGKINNICNPINTNIDMKNEKQQAILPLENDETFKINMQNKTVEASTIDNTTTAKISGNMPINTNANITSITKDQAINIANKHISLTSENLVAAYNISLNTEEKEYQPKEYKESVNVELSNVSIDLNKQYAMLHILDNNNYEILPIEKISENKISFKTTSFSTYMLIQVASHTVTFTGENYKVYDLKGNEITNGMTIADGANFAFTIEPNDGYGVTNVTSSAGTIEVNGYEKMKSAIISSVTQDLTIDVTTVLEPKIITHPVSTKTNIGDTTTFTVVAQNATTYQWQYRDSSDTGFINVETDGTSQTLSIIVTEELSGREYRCLVGNANFTDDERIESDVVSLFITDEDLTAKVVVNENLEELLPRITKQPVSAKIKIGETATFIAETQKVTDYIWQYKVNNSTDDWKYVDETLGTTISIASGYDTNTLKIDTSGMTLNEDTLTILNDISGYIFRCIGTSTEMPSFEVISDIVYVSIAQDDIFEDNIKVKIPTIFEIETDVAIEYQDITEIPFTYNGDGQIKVTSSDDSCVSAEVSGNNIVVTGNTLGNVTLTIINEGAIEYTPHTEIVNITVNPRTITVLPDSNQSKIYREADPVFTYTYTNDLAYEPIKFEGALVRVAGENVGEYKINLGTLKLVDNGAFIASNYNLVLSDTVVNFAIYRREPILFADPASLVIQEWTQKTSTITYDGDGVISIESQDEGVATAVLEDRLITVTGVAKGKTNITISVTQGQNYLAKTIELPIEIKASNYIIGTIYHETLEEAFNAAVDGDTIKVVKDFPNDDSLAILDKTVTIDTNGCTVTKTVNPIKVAENGVLNIIGNGTIKSNDITIDNEGKLNVFSGTIEGTKYAIISDGDQRTVTIGDSQTELNTNNPQIIGGEYAIYTDAEFVFNNGLLKGTNENVFHGIVMPRQIEYTVEISGPENGYYSAYMYIDVEKLFVTEWTIPVDVDGKQATTGSSQTTVKLPIPSNPSNDFYVDWGDGTYERYFETDFPAHTYENETETVYTVKIAGKVNQFGFMDTAEITAGGTNKEYYTSTKYITGLKAWGKINTTRYSFSQCTNLASTIPAPVEESFKSVVDMSLLFYNCGKLNGEIPTDFFKYATEVTGFEKTFSGCSKLSGTIASNLFTTNTKVTTFEGTFENCSTLSGNIPAELFKTNTKATTFAETFKGCNNLTGTISASLFETNKEVESFKETFNSCEKLEGNIPAQLFTNNTKAKDFSGTFKDCGKLSGHIPAELFEANTQATLFEETFMNCVGLTSGELRINTTNVTNVDNMFNGCKGLETLAFREDFKLLNGEGMFNECSALKAIILENNAMTPSEVATLGELNTINLPETTIIYVPSEESEKVYEAKWISIFGTEPGIDEVTGVEIEVNKAVARVEPILQLIGDNPIYTEKDEEYTDPGYTVAGFKVDEKSKYEIYGYTITENGLPVDTTTKGTKLVNYVFNNDGTKGMGVIRQVIVLVLDLSKAEVLMSQTEFEYNGEYQTPSIYVKLDGNELMKNVDYKVEFTNNKNAGTANIVITSTSIYKNEWTGTFEIKPRALNVIPESEIVKFAGREEPIIHYEYENNIEGETPKFSGALVRDKAGTPEGELEGLYDILIGTLKLEDNGDFLANNYQLILKPETVRVYGESATKNLFIIKWSVDAGETIKLPILDNELNKYDVIWDDGIQSHYTNEAFPTHTYETAGEYEIAIYGTCKSFGYYGEQAPTENNIAKEYYRFTQNLIEIIQWGDLKAERLGFAHCINLSKALPKTTGFSQITSMENMFNNCTSLPGPIPANFTEEAYNVTTVKNMFKNCINLNGSIPVDVFIHKEKITTFEDVFNGCINLSGSIPEYLFAKAISAKSFARAFKDCSKLTGTLPVYLFYNATEVENFSETFANCTGLTSDYAEIVDENKEIEFLKEVIPAGFFDNNRKVRNYYRMFYNCTGLTGEVVTNLLSSNLVLHKISNESLKYSDYRGMFEGCTGIEKVSLSLQEFGREMFKGCTGIKEIELRDVFKLGNEAFYGCNQLTNINIDENFFKVIGTDAFEYTGTNPTKLVTTVNRSNEILMGYNWSEDNRILDVEGPKGTVRIITDKYPFTKTQDVLLQINVTDNYSSSENCEMAIINEDKYKEGVTYDDLKWQPYAEEVAWELTPDDAAKTVYVYFRDEAGNVCETLEYLDGRIKIISSTDTFIDNEPIEISLASAFAGNNRQKTYKLRKEISIHRSGDGIEYVEYTSPVTISQEGDTYVSARLVEEITGVVLDEVEQLVSLDFTKPGLIEYDVIRGTETGENSYYGQDQGPHHEDSNGVVIKVFAGEDYNSEGNMNYGISEIRYTVVKDGEKTVDDEVLLDDTIWLKEEGIYSVIISETDIHGNHSEAVTISVSIVEIP